MSSLGLLPHAYKAQQLKEPLSMCWSSLLTSCWKSFCDEALARWGRVPGSREVWPVFFINLMQIQFLCLCLYFDHFMKCLVKTAATSTCIRLANFWEKPKRGWNMGFGSLCTTKSFLGCWGPSAIIKGLRRFWAQGQLLRYSDCHQQCNFRQMCQVPGS